MASVGRSLPAKGIMLLAIVGAAGCSPRASLPGAPTGSSPPALAPSASVASSVAATVAPTVLEDAGIHVELPPGSYTSRVFDPRLVLDLPAGWLRRDDVTPVHLPLRAAEANVTITVLHIDFVQCSTTLLDHPSARAAADLIAASGVLSPGPREPLELGDRSADNVSLPGSGDPIPGEFDYAHVDERMCILTSGPAAFPDPEGQWVILTPDLRAELVFADVAGEFILLAGRSPDELPDTVSGLVRPVFATVRFPDAPPGG